MKYLAPALACLGLLMPTLTATSIEFVGVETDIPDSGYLPASNWSNSAVAKIYDLNGDDLFGGAGYYQITPGIVPDGIWSQPVSDGNDLGITALYPTLYDPPSFLSGNPIGSEGIFYNSQDFPMFCDPTGTLDQQGALSVTVKNTVISEPGGVVYGWNKVFSFTLGEAVTFRIGVAVDTVGSETRAPDKVSIANGNAGEVFSDPLSREGFPDMVFFDITGNAGEVFDVNLWQTNTEIGTSGPVAFSLITFDRAPIPTLTHVQDGNNILLSWEQNIPGWILESSTDLGSGDDWDPVPGVVNNSVTVPMTGVPKNFFRLRKDP